MAKILIVDDDKHLRHLIRTYADLDGYICEEADQGETALEKLGKSVYDLIVLDIMMPGIDGFEVLSHLRNHSETPVIMLTSRSEEYDKLMGFNLGADDYISKPFSPKELMARVKAVLKRTATDSTETLVFGELSISPGTRCVFIDRCLLV